MGRKLFVGNLSFNTDERRLEELFQSIGAVDSVNIVRDQMTGRARGFAFVEMQSDELAQTRDSEVERNRARRPQARRERSASQTGRRRRRSRRPRRGGGGGPRRREPRW